MEWIRVEDRLPDERTTVICFCDRFSEETGIFTGLLTARGTFDVQIGEFCGGELDVTHWMPLPEPPKDPNG